MYILISDTLFPFFISFGSCFQNLKPHQCFSFIVSTCVPKLPYGGNVLIVTLLKISKVSKSIFYYILINFVKADWL